ncbi:MAG TPA: adenylate kinase [Planctomycetaceae bacterium]|nr:adenylate kinase [Planctomycetaceae bacterium]
MINPIPAPEPQQLLDLEIKDAQLIFKNVWEELVEEYGVAELRFPKELILLGGAPGSGKGTHTRFVMQARGLTCPPIVVSELLTSPAAQKIKDQGGMVGDKEVIAILFRRLLNEEFRDGAVLDGFPRTRVQVECLKQLVDNVNRLHKDYADTEHAIHFRRPTVHAMVLFVSEKTSVDRQLLRGEQIAQHNREVEETGVGSVLPIRSTDLQPDTARRRYRVFKEQTWSALQSLKEIYHYHFINAEGPIEEVEANILRELQYQSSLELHSRTFDRLRPIALAEDIVLHARQQLVNRLDSYELEHTDLFIRVVNVIQSKFMPIVQRHALSGRAQVNTEDTIFHNPLALSMLIDIFSERGYHAVVDKHIQPVPERYDPHTGKVELQEKVIYRVQINFKGSQIRRG